jgi:hypothetical protein
MSASKSKPAWWDDCDNCGHKAKRGTLCDNCGFANRSREHTHMAYGNSAEAGHYAVVSDNEGWASDSRPQDRFLHAQKESVRATLRVCGIEYRQ